MDALMKSFDEFKKYDWKVECDPQKSKKENEFDVIIVGSGMGGLSSGAILSKRGYRVLILEQNSFAGGFFTSFKKNGFEFSGGAEDLNEFRENGAFDYFLKELGFRREDFFKRNTRAFYFKGHKIPLGENLDDFISRMQEIFPDEKESIPAFFDDVKTALGEMNDQKPEFGVIPPFEITMKLHGPAFMNVFLGNRPHLYDWMSKTYKQKLDEYFKNRRLKLFLCALLGYLGTKVDETPGVAAMGGFLTYYVYGGYYPVNGCRHFTNSVVGFIESYGGKILKNQKVDKILIENGEVQGVISGGIEFHAPVVVSNCNARTTFLDLAGKENLSPAYFEYIKNLQLSASFFMLHLGVDKDLSHLSRINMDLDLKCGFKIDNGPPLAPVGHSGIAILTFAGYKDFPERGTPEYNNMKKELAEKCIEKLEHHIPDIREHIVVQDAASPKTFERYVSVPEGAVYVFDQSTKTRRPFFKTPVKGLYLAGASVIPGAGVSSAIISGVNAANDICGWRKFG